MPVTEEADEEAAYQPLLADHHSADLLGEGFDPHTVFLDATVEFLDGWIHKTFLKLC